MKRPIYPYILILTLLLAFLLPVAVYTAFSAGENAGQILDLQEEVSSLSDELDAEQAAKESLAENLSSAASENESPSSALASCEEALSEAEEAMLAAEDAETATEDAQLSEDASRMESEIEKMIADAKETDGIFETLDSSDYPFQNADPEHFDYLAIGNSLTVHGISDYWWSWCGMAATSPEKDYFHLVDAGLEKRYGVVESQCFGLNAWENHSLNRTETLEGLPIYLNENVDLVTVQVGENVSDAENFYEDLTHMIRIIQRLAPDARILLIGSFYERDIEPIKKQAAKDLGISYVDLSAVWGNSSYQAGIGYTVTGEDGLTHVVEKRDAAIHPNDRGMEFIANHILAVLDFQDTKGKNTH